MKDFLKQELSVGDRVVHGVGGARGGLDGPFFIHSFTLKMVRISRHFGPGAQVYSCVPPRNLVKVPA